MVRQVRAYDRKSSTSPKVAKSETWTWYKHQPVSRFKKVLDGEILLGFMKLDEDSLRDGKNVVIYYGDRRKPKAVLLYAPNQDYSMYDKWEFEIIEPPARDSRYKAIGEEMRVVINRNADRTWHDDLDTVQFTIKTKSKELRFGHHWHDCHYPSSLWEVL